jgi:hypothetical protein
MRTFSISLLVLVGIYFMSFFSVVAQKAGVETLSQSVVRDAVAFVLPRYQVAVDRIAMEYEKTSVQGGVEAPANVSKVNYASVLGAVEDFRKEFWK